MTESVGKVCEALEKSNDEGLNMNNNTKTSLAQHHPPDFIRINEKNSPTCAFIDPLCLSVNARYKLIL